MTTIRVHAKNFCPDGVVTPSHTLSLAETSGRQAALRLAFGVHRAPKDAPAKVVRQVETPAQALTVSMRAAKLKQDTVARLINRSRTYVCLMASGKRPIPDKLVSPLCAATGSNLLAQVIALQTVMEDGGEVERLARMLRDAA